MKNFFRFGLFAGLLSTLLISTGCASRMMSTKKRVNVLEAQVGVLTDEITRLDQQLQEIRAQGHPAPRPLGATTAAQTAIYRTPSGFELPSADIQKALKGAGYYQGPVDGRIGPTTKDAVKAFQKDHGLNADGVVGRRTWDKLKVYLTSAAGN